MVELNKELNGKSPKDNSTLQRPMKGQWITQKPHVIARERREEARKKMATIETEIRQQQSAIVILNFIGTSGRSGVMAGAGFCSGGRRGTGGSFGTRYKAR
ncbi:hypothetical protein Ancab_008533 [Ancistrocladus abbreviatus]